MPNRRTLVLLTKQFPFQHREQYVAHELPFLAAQFDRVIIYPHDHFTQNDHITFELPQNVEVWDLNHEVPSVSKWNILPAFLRAYFYELFRTHNRRWWLGNFRRFMAIYFTQFALGERLLNALKSSSEQDEEFVFYSYWFSASALCLSILKSRGRIAGFTSRAHALDCYHESWGLLNERTQVLPFRHLKQREVTSLRPISEHAAQFLLQSSECRGKVHVAYLGVEPGKRNPLAMAGEAMTIATCSGVDNNKRIHLLGQALKALDKPVHWIHFGDGPMRNAAMQSVEGSSVVLEYRGQTSNAEIRRFYEQRHIDLFVNVSQVEGLPVTIMEALAHGIPVLATGINGTPETIVHGANGWLVPVGISSEGLAKEMESALRALCTAEARDAAHAHYDQHFQARVNYGHFAQALAADANLLP